MAEKKKVSAVARKAGKIMAATAANKERRTGYQKATSLKHNRSAVAGKARAVDAATKGKKTSPSKVSVSSVGGGKVTPPVKYQQARNRQLVMGIASAVGGAGIGRAVGSAAVRAAQPVKLAKEIATIKNNYSRGLLAKSEVNKLILDANMQYNRGAFFGQAKLEGISKVTANKLLGTKIPPYRGK